MYFIETNIYHNTGGITLYVLNKEEKMTEMDRRKRYAPWKRRIP